MKKIISVLLVLNAQFGFSQSENPHIQNFTSKSYGKNINPEIYSIAQDDRHNIIAGTSNGVLIYNGKDWAFIGIREGTYVTSLLKSTDGAILIGAVGEFGKLTFNENGKYFYKSLYSQPSLKEPFWKIHEINNIIYFQSEEKIYVVQNDSIIEKISSESSFHLSFNLNNRLIIRQREKGLFELKNNKLIPFDTTNNGIFAIFSNENENKYFIRNEESSNNIEKSVYGGIKLKDGNYAVYTLEDGIFILNENFDVINKIDKKNGLNDNDIKNIIQDNSGNLWAATNNGISFIEYQSDLSFYGEKDGVSGDVECMSVLNNRLILGTSKGVYTQNKGGFNLTKIHFPTWDMINDNGNILCATSEGIFKIERNYDIEKILSGNFNNILKVNNLFYCSGTNGITITDLNFKTIKKIEIPLNRTLKILHNKQKDEIWIGTVGSGLIRIFSNLNVEIYDDMDGLDISWTKPAIHHNSSLIFLTKSGMQKFVYEDEVKNILPDSLKDNPDFYRGFFEPIFTNSPISEIFKFRNKNMLVADNQIKMNESDSRIVNTAYSIIENGRINNTYIIEENLFVCTSEGLIKISKNELKNTQKLLLYFDEIKTTDSLINIESSSEIPHYKNQIIFKFYAPLYNRDNKVFYTHILEGYDSDWSAFSEDNFLKYDNLKEGNYTLKIQAVSNRGLESNIIEYSFKILPPWYRTLWAYISYLVAIIFIVWIAVKIGVYRLKKKNEELEKTIKERTKEIAHQKEIIEEKHNEIKDSINYAQRIQTALMASEDHWQNISKEHFILFRPRDVVSGDFYWAFQNENIAVWTVADCTGHGVPGAFMSMLGIGFLNEIVIESKNFEPAQILNLLREKIIKSLEQKNTKDERKDGMDISLCVLDKKQSVLKFAGANNPLVIVTSDAEKLNYLKDEKMIENNGKYLILLSGDKMPVGKYLTDNKPFSQTEIKVKKDDVFYSFSDGYHDQFGGEEGRKFMIKKLKQLLLSISDLPVESQKEKLNQTFDNWLKEGETEQIDDVCIVGVKF